MYDITCVDFNGSNANHWFDIEIDGSDNWYVNLWCDNVSYCAEIGFRSAAGVFVPIIRSNVVQTPRACPSPRRDVSWIDIRQTPATATPVSPEPSFPAPIAAGNEPPVIGAGEEGRQVVTVHPVKESPESTDRPASPEAGRFDQAPPYCTPSGKAVESARVRDVEAAHSLPSSFETVSFGGASDILVGRPGSVFDLYTDVVVFGRTEPDAIVTIHDQTVQAESDGSFAVRLPLPEGHLAIECTVVNRIGSNRRKVNTGVYRLPTDSKAIE